MLSQKKVFCVPSKFISILGVELPNSAEANKCNPVPFGSVMSLSMRPRFWISPLVTLRTYSVILKLKNSNVLSTKTESTSERFPGALLKVTLFSLNEASILNIPMVLGSPAEVFWNISNVTSPTIDLSMFGSSGILSNDRTTLDPSVPASNVGELPKLVSGKLESISASSVMEIVSVSWFVATCARVFPVAGLNVVQHPWEVKSSTTTGALGGRAGAAAWDAWQTPRAARTTASQRVVQNFDTDFIDDNLLP